MATLTADELQVLARLSATIEARRGADPESSYTARLIADPAFAVAKVSEEAQEVVDAAANETPADLAREAADLVYHLMALLAARGVGLGNVLAELARREGTSGLAEKAAREGH